MKITPFNLKEEMEEGGFDAEGNYFEKKEDVIRDSWLDDIDWVKVKELEKGQKTIAEAMDEGTDVVQRPEKEILQEILPFLKPGESITKGLRRLGGKKSTPGNRRRWKKDKEEEKKEGEGSEENKEEMLKLTGLVDELVSNGIYEAYQYTYERISHHLKQEEEKEKKKEEDAFDMFAEDVDEKKLNTQSTTSSSGKDPWEKFWELTY